jgi:hypothetical protein
MMKFFYGLFVSLHPRAFRERFAAEMTLNFEEAGAERSGRLVFDCFVSLLRQWLLHSGLWKLVLAVAIAFLQLMAIGPAWHTRGRFPRLAHTSLSSLSEQEVLVLLVLCVTAFVVVLAMIIAFWVRSLVTERLKKARGWKASIAGQTSH